MNVKIKDVSQPQSPTQSQPRPQTARGIARRQALLETALRLFEENGYANTSINEIVRQAGGSLSTAYKWFPGKEDLFLEVFRYQLKEIRKFIEAIPVEAKTLEEAIHSILSAAYHFSVERQIRTFLFDGIHIRKFRETALPVFHENLGDPITNRLKSIEQRFSIHYKLGVELTTLLLIRQIRGTAIEFVLNREHLETRKKKAVDQTTAFFMTLVERPKRGRKQR